VYAVCAGDDATMMMALVAEADRQSPRRRRRRRRRCVYGGALAPSPLNRSAQTPSHHRTVTDELQPVLNERVITGTRKFNTYGRRAFSVAGSMAWNSLPDFIRDPTSSTDCFRRLLKTYLFTRY